MHFKGYFSILSIVVFSVLSMVGCSDLHFKKDTVTPGLSGFARQIARKDCQEYKGQQYQECLDSVDYYKGQKEERKLDELNDNKDSQWNW